MDTKVLIVINLKDNIRFFINDTNETLVEDIKQASSFYQDEDIFVVKMYGCPLEIEFPIGQLQSIQLTKTESINFEKRDKND